MAEKEKMKYGSLNRFVQAVTGLFLLFFLGVHLYVAHIDFGHPVAFFSSVINQLHNPWWLGFFLIFVYIITYHGVNGLNHIIADTSISEKAKRNIGIALMVIYVITIIYGTILALLVAKMTVPS
ncbi:succinate dehydrogenase hydrophobic membrane anchor subunit [Thermoplasma sp.]|uniref:succinate dehydrogenase hydrophobic membrane anchor subunit n=1 Tax=Thermoplasma sp. TaxID=1973142 RepID=UPI002602F5F7|nr:succinate dehydrogenase hydrophobic membrane anchor subunit [Thermoplasma sp.]